MKVPYNWLLEYVDIDRDINEVADAMTLSGSKVEEVVEIGKEIDRVVTGKIIKRERHPDADKLQVCQVDIGSEVIQIVTGADNIETGDIIPAALHGSSLPGGVKIKKGKLRGLESNGMMCSEVELGIAGEESVHGIMILPQDTPLGVDIKEILGLNGGIIDFEITSNRADCFGVYGIAREAAATLGYKLKPVEVSFKEDSDTIKNYLTVEIQDPLCRRYAAKMIKNVKVGPSPEWMKQKLEEAGVRPINNIVDITNYVMLELGQPMHAFDYRNIDGKRIVVRRAEEGEGFTTLDGVQRKLDSSMLVIADGAKAVAAAGVMGGQNSEVLEDTNTIVFEIANFNGPNVRLTAKKLGLRTESSSRFEKDIDPNLVELAMKRACHLTELLGAGEVVGDVIDIYPEKLTPHTVEVSSKWINDFLGMNIEVSRMKEILDSLEMKSQGEETLTIEVPTFRQDVKLREDVAEEIVRIYGYDRIPSVKIQGEAVEAVWTEEQKLTKLTRETMVASGLYEAITYSFVSPKIFDSINLPNDSALRNTIRISNPLGEDFSVMRTTAIPSMLEVLGRNYARDAKDAALFEVGRIYLNKNEDLPDERDQLIIGMYGRGDFFALKGVLENLIGALGIDRVDFEPESQNPSFHPGRCAKLLVRRKPAGVLGEVHPEVAEKYGFGIDRVYMAEIDLRTLFEASKLEKRYKALPKFPAVTRDIAMLISEDVTIGEIESVIGRAGKELMESMKLFDVYKGKQIPEGMKSVAYSIVYRGEDKTLTDEEVNKVHEKVVKALGDKLKAQLR
jgi:phenylalanyl-tRNA synthetase beta chain